MLLGIRAIFALAALLSAVDARPVARSANDHSRAFEPPAATHPPQPPAATDLVAEAACLADASRVKESAERYQQAISRARETGDRPSHALALLGLGRIQMSEGRFPVARSTLEEALRIFTDIGEHRGQARVHGALAEIEWSDDRPAARRHYELQLAAFERAGDQQGQAGTLVSLAYAALGRAEAMTFADRGLALARTSGNAIAEGNAHHIAGDLLFLDGDYAAALDRLEQAVACFERVGATSRIARVFVSMGRLHRVHGRNDLALDVHRRALRVQEAAGNLEGRIQSHNAIAVALGNLDRPDEALEQYARALELAHQFGASDLIAYQRTQLAAAYLRKGDARRAIELYEQGLAAVKTPFNEMSWTLGLSWAYGRVKEYDRALDAATRTEALIRTHKFTTTLPDALDARAYALRGLGRLDEALVGVREALDALEQQRERAIPSDTLKQSFGASFGRSYTLAIDLMHRLGRDVEALETAERARARAFLDLLAARNAAAQTRPAVSRLTDTGADLPSAASTPPLTAGELAALARRLDSTLLVYWVDNDRTLAWVVKGDGSIQVAEIKTTRAVLAELVGRSWGSAGARSSKKVWRDLYDLVIDPVRRFLPASHDSLVTIVPHGPLFGLSFPALLDADGRYLIEHYRMHVAPAGATLKFTEQRKAQALRPAKYLFVADPEGLPEVGDTGPLRRLEGATSEVSAIASRLPADSFTVLARADATEQRVRALAGRQTVLHFATHGVLRDDAQESFLALGSTDRKAPGDGRLTVNEIYDLRLKADLVVMSACRTARGRVSGDGVLGLTRAFFYAGTPSIVATLWDVADEAGSRLMPAFYEHLQASSDKSRALRAAQLEMIRALRAGDVKVKTPAGLVPLRENPFLWASYILVGEP